MPGHERARWPSIAAGKGRCDYFLSKQCGFSKWEPCSHDLVLDGHLNTGQGDQWGPGHDACLQDEAALHPG